MHGRKARLEFNSYQGILTFMKSFILSAVLAFIGALSVNAQEILPIPKCYPCGDLTETIANETIVTETVVADTNILPIPKCYPCGDLTEEPAAEVNILPIPKCYPCGDLTSQPEANLNLSAQSSRVRVPQFAILRERAA